MIDRCEGEECSLKEVYTTTILGKREARGSPTYDAGGFARRPGNRSHRLSFCLIFETPLCDASGVTVAGPCLALSAVLR